MVQRSLSGSDQPVRYSFNKNEILRGEKQYQRIIYSGKVISIGMIQCYFILYKNLDTSSRPVMRVGFSVPRRRVRKAVDRNRLKRLLRESFRIHKPMLVEQLHKNQVHLDVLIMYRGRSSRKPRHTKLAEVLPDMIRLVELLSGRIKAGSEK